MKLIVLIGLLVFVQSASAEEPLKVIISDGLGSGDGQYQPKIEPKIEANIKTKKLLSVPGTAGDPLNAVFSLPGVLVSPEDGTPAVRGSSPEDNRFFVDFLPAGNVYHAFGFSVFNDKLLADFTLLPASYPAPYGNATGAVFDITTRDPKAQDWEFTVDTTLIKVGFLAEGQIKPGHNAYFSYRKSLLDLFIEEGEEDNGVVISDIPVLQDYQGKYTWDLADDSRLSFGLLGSSDTFGAEITAASPEARLDPDVVGRQTLDTSFNRQSITWDKLYDNNAALKLAFGLYQNSVKVNLGAGQFLDLDNDNIVLKGQYDFDVNPFHRVSVGSSLGNSKTTYAFDIKISPCTDFDPDCQPDASDRSQDDNKIDSNSYEFYVQDEWKPNLGFKTILGLNSSYDDYLKETLHEPRLALEWRNSRSHYKRIAMGEYHRTPDDEQIAPEIGNPELDNVKARHITFSYGEDNAAAWDWNIDVYYKELYDLAIADDINNYSNNAEGEAYGVELLLEKQKSGSEDKWYGWASLSWSRSERTDLSTGQTNVFTGDTPLVFNAVYNYQASPRWNVGLRYTYRTGSAYTPVVNIEANPDFPGLFRPVYAELNSDRLPDYQRLDIRSEYDFRMFKKKAKFIVDVLNLLNNENINSIDYEPSQGDAVDNFRLVSEKDIAFFPSIGLQVTF